MVKVLQYPIYNLDLVLMVWTIVYSGPYIYFQTNGSLIIYNSMAFGIFI